MTFLKVALVVLAGCVAACCAKAVDPIVNGRDAAPGEYPWQILLKYDGVFTCGGSLIRDDVVMTAAHCVEDDPDQSSGSFSIVAGEHNVAQNDGTEEEVSVDTVVMHESYSRFTLENDIALLFLSSPVTLTSSVATVPVLSNDDQDDDGLGSKKTWVSGWGAFNDKTKASPDILQELKTKIVTNRKCNKKLKKYGFSVTDDMVCTLNKKAGVCFGDSGGPMGFYNTAGNFVQVGIVSWGPSRKCANGRQVFTRVSSYRDWIDSKL